MKVGIISFAHGHAYSYASALQKIEDVEIIGIADEEDNRGQQAADTFAADYFETYQELLAKEPDAVIVTSENSRHREHVVAAAEAGVSVLCEKPLAHKEEDAKAMIQACREAGVLLQTAFPVRFSQAMQRAREVIKNGEIGEIQAMKGTNRGKNPGGWFTKVELSGGGAVMDHTVHIVDIMRWVTGKEVTEVYAEIDTHFTNEDIDDSGLLTLVLGDAIFATLDCSWSRSEQFPMWGDATIEFVGTKGTLKADVFAQKLDVYHREGLNWTFWGDDMDQALVENFIESIRTHRDPSVTGEDGLRALEVALGAYESGRTKQPVILKYN
ncbi:Gfo/Idh/MocA family protein [Virgibacillus natechei]